jgi:hypothetical protein
MLMVNTKPDFSGRVRAFFCKGETGKARGLPAGPFMDKKDPLWIKKKATDRS